MLYVYAIADPGVKAPTQGIKGSEVRTIRAEGFDVLVSEHENIETSADIDDLWAHEAVVEAAGDNGCSVLPLRMGSIVADEEAVVALVEERAHEFSHALDRVRGAVELGVRAAVSPAGEETSEPRRDERPGTAYLMSRLAQKQRGDEIIDLVHRPLATMARDHLRLDKTLGEPSSVRLAYLVDDDAVEPFRARVQELDTELDHVRLACTGPWPPYSFTGGQSE